MAAGLRPGEAGTDPPSLGKGGCREALANGEQRGTQGRSSSDNTPDKKEGLREPETVGNPEGPHRQTFVQAQAGIQTQWEARGLYLHANEVQTICKTAPQRGSPSGRGKGEKTGPCLPQFNTSWYLSNVQTILGFQNDAISVPV